MSIKTDYELLIMFHYKERIVTRLGGAPVCNRSIEPVPMLCYSSIQSPMSGVRYMPQKDFFNPLKCQRYL